MPLIFLSTHGKEAANRRPLFLAMRNPFTWLLLVVLLLTALVYLPGLKGAFLFDDYANLPALGATGPIDNWPAFWRYITSGAADPTGRPVALLSFLIDARNWPADPLPFKCTNLALHLLNGAMLALLLRGLGRQRFPHAHARTDLAAVIGAAFWLLHPLFVSTTLYIVQREAMLPVAFTLLGLLGWLRGRMAMAAGRYKAGIAWITAGLCLCTVLGVLSKANGILLPLLALTIEGALFDPSTRTRIYRRTMWVLAGIPTLLLISYLTFEAWHGLVHGISLTRPWTLSQRLLTEPRVVLIYLSLLWLPRTFTSGLFNDQVHASASIFSPWTTLPSIIALSTLILFALHTRRRWPAVAAALLFYFAGHLLESSTVALELFFEHRNYLPAMLLFWPLTLWLAGVQQGAAPGSLSPPGHPHLKLLIACVLVAMLATMTLARSTLWGNEHDQAVLWAAINPESPRAQAYAAQAEMAAGQPDRAAARLRLALAAHPDEVQVALNLFAAECDLGEVSGATLDASRRALETTRNPGALLTSWFTRAIGQLSHPQCSAVNAEVLTSLLQATQRNPLLMKEAGRRQDILYLFGHLALAQRQPDVALDYFNRATDQQLRISAALMQAAELGAAGFPTQGLSHLDHFELASGPHYQPGMGMPRIHAWLLARQDYWPRELAHLRATLTDDAKATHSAQK